MARASYIWRCSFPLAGPKDTYRLASSHSLAASLSQASSSQLSASLPLSPAVHSLSLPLPSQLQVQATAFLLWRALLRSLRCAALVRLFSTGQPSGTKLTSTFWSTTSAGRSCLKSPNPVTKSIRIRDLGWGFGIGSLQTKNGQRCCSGDTLTRHGWAVEGGTGSAFTFMGSWTETWAQA